MANRIHPTAVLGAGVELGDENVIGPYAVVSGPCRIGNRNWIGPHVSIGGFGPAGEPSAGVPTDSATNPGVVIGDGSIIREFVTIRQGLHHTTRLGNNCYLMGRAHVHHDAVLDDDVVVSSAVQLASGVRVGAWANIGIGTIVQPGLRVGPGAMVGMGSDVRRDVPPFTITVGTPARTTGVNRVGLSRRGCSDAAIDAVAAFLTGRAGLPSELPADIADRLRAWAVEPSAVVVETVIATTGPTTPGGEI